MNEEVGKYLSKIHENLHLNPSTEKVIIREIYYHLADKIYEVILCGEAHLFVSFLFLFHLWSNSLVLGVMMLLG